MKRDWNVHVDSSCNHPLKWSHFNLGRILSNQELIIEMIQEIERCKRGMCKTNEGNVKQRWRAALLTGTYMCAADGAPVEAGGHTYRIDRKEGTLVHGDCPGPDGKGRSVAWASADTLVGLGLAHEALHAVFPGHSHKNITGDDGLEKCITCGGRL